ncbi:hypothetical protein PG987_005245 [Apiospora arundinis]
MADAERNTKWFGDIGRDKDIERVKDKNHYDKSLSKYGGGNHKRAVHFGGEGIGNLIVPDFMFPSRKDIGYNTNEKRRRRQLEKRNRRLNTLIVTPHPEDSAKALCGSNTSYGADQVFLAEKMFCDMETKTLYPLCEEDDTMFGMDNATASVRVRSSAEQQEGDKKKTEENGTRFNLASKTLLLPDGQRDPHSQAMSTREGSKVYGWYQFW